MAAYKDTPNNAPDYQWFHDISSTHHLTNELSNLNVRADECTGTYQIRVGSGQGLKISHIGLAKLSSPHHTFCLSSLFLISSNSKKKKSPLCL